MRFQTIAVSAADVLTRLLIVKDELRLVRFPSHCLILWFLTRRGSLDTIGLAGFSHDFGALDGEHASVTMVFDTFSASPPPSAMNIAFNLLSQVFPFLLRLPTSRTKLIWKLNSAMEEISNVLLARTKKELDMGVVGEEEKSVIGLLSTPSVSRTPFKVIDIFIVKGESAESEFHLSKEEVLAQVI